MSKKPWERRGRMSAKEFVALLEADPEYQATMAKVEKERQRHIARFCAEERPILKDLRKAGFKVKTLYDILNMYGAGLPWERIKPTRPYAEALPILFKHLQRPYPADVRCAIAQVMNSRQSRPYWDDIKRMYFEEKDDLTQQMLANILASVAKGDKNLLPEVIDYMRNGKNGMLRSFLVDVLTHFARDERAQRALQDLKDDPDLKGAIGRYFHQRELRQRRKARQRGKR